jgi:S-DNA-T family DNA segregation ATPase FtsK/SpoIIIE
MPHLLVAGWTGGGKTVGLVSFIASMLWARGPSELRLVLVDPKTTEFRAFAGLPGVGLLSEASDAADALSDLCDEMDRRYRAGGFWTQRIVVVVDELADLLCGPLRRAIEGPLVRLAQKGRAAGIHLILATQRPSVDVLPGLLKANMPARLAFALRTKVDSRVVLDCNGAEALLGKGDCLFLGPGGALERLHGARATEGQLAGVRRRRGAPGGAGEPAGGCWAFSIRSETIVASRAGAAALEIMYVWDGAEALFLHCRGASPEVLSGARAAFFRERGGTAEKSSAVG